MGASFEVKRSRVTPEMNVTPLVDVVLVLLIIFMVLAPVMTEAFRVRLPPQDDKDEQLDQVNDLDAPLVLGVADDGKLAVNHVVIEASDLPTRLRRMLNARPDTVLYLDGADATRYGSVVAAIDLARQGGAAPVVIITKRLN